MHWSDGQSSCILCGYPKAPRAPEAQQLALAPCPCSRYIRHGALGTEDGKTECANLSFHRNSFQRVVLGYLGSEWTSVPSQNRLSKDKHCKVHPLWLWNALAGRASSSHGASPERYFGCQPWPERGAHIIDKQVTYWWHAIRMSFVESFTCLACTLNCWINSAFAILPILAFACCWWKERSFHWNYQDVKASKTKTIKLASKLMEPFVPCLSGGFCKTLLTFPVPDMSAIHLKESKAAVGVSLQGQVIIIHRPLRQSRQSRKNQRQETMVLYACKSRKGPVGFDENSQSSCGTFSTMATHSG